MVAGVIHISDEFELGADKDNDSDGGDTPFFTNGMKNNVGDVILPVKGGVEYEAGEGESCMNTLAAALGAPLLLMIQCVLIGVWTALCRKRRKCATAAHGEADGGDAATRQAVSEVAGSSLREYDPYFAEDIGTQMHHRYGKIY